MAHYNIIIESTGVTVGLVLTFNNTDHNMVGSDMAAIMIGLTLFVGK
jgi:hypothetical protein